MFYSPQVFVASFGDTPPELAIQAFDKIADNIAARGKTFLSSSDLEPDETEELGGAELSQADVSLSRRPDNED